MQLWLIPLFPFIGFLMNGLFGRRFPKSVVNLFAIGSVVLAFGWALRAILGVRYTPTPCPAQPLAAC